MPGEIMGSDKLLRTRLLYVAFIDSVLLAWNQGYEIANPHKNIRQLSCNHELIIDAVVGYFSEVTKPVDRIPDTDVGYGYVLSEEARQLSSRLQSIYRIHKAVTMSSRESARMIAGRDMLDTIRNLIVYFEERR